ncbi:helix-turn-helix transcriptional regulator [Chryseobacterium contaminans]|uniref:helix-turn-helix transcriptional regulator n=1 Tax=Chryseobacterium contaminans TaxID=1423959 RepID=UPI0030192AFD
MKKAKLRTIRKQKGYSQQQVADVIPTEVSNYSRKENGYIKITKNEWEKIARFFNVPVEEIYEADYPVHISNEISGENIHAYISQLEKENIALLKKIEILKNIINH